MWRYCEWTSFASVDGLFWKRICPVLVLLHKTWWAVCVCINVLFFKVSLPSCYSTFPSPYHHGWVYLALQNYILNSLLGYFSCRYPKLDIYSTKLSHPWITPLSPSSSQSLCAFYSLFRSLCILSSPLHSCCHDHFVTGSLLSVSLLCISSSRK